MDSNSIEKIKDLTRRSSDIKKINDLEYSYDDLALVSPPRPSSVEVMSLESLVDFVSYSINPVHLDNYLYHVISPTRVSIIENKYNKYGQRLCLSNADISDQINNNFNYGHEYSLEDFIIAVNGAFAPTENRTKLIDSISRVSVQEGDEIEDDGFTQQVASKAGVHLKSMITLPNPILLKPYKTFPEIKAPEESFVFRVSKDSYNKKIIKFKLFNSKSMIWELTCVAEIKKYLKQNSSLKVI